ncbi:DUF3667 domain-containing protein [Tenacibaculum sp. M341]|uniref:DUF3667 domain-containing protein n=1 Tax=Tenacibaculum sp. M341 TaxID=2530339 RepID=UPI00104A694A|nr:DUF3667 domain-containing protein [Tenacibaculum sp. M341]TCI92180.1 DUF3667 domain-containing protein [Tenacibaculum sp. M341]
MTCKNCGNTVIGNYCSNCGQSTKVNNINLSNFITEVSNSVFQIDKGFFFTLKELFVRPGHSIREFINGKRKNHFKPIAFILTLSTIYFLISKISDGHTIIDNFLASASDAGDKHNLNTSSSNLAKWLSNNYAYTALLLLPVFSFATYISFVDFKKNYLEHIVINAYVTGQQTIFYSFF